MMSDKPQVKLYKSGYTTIEYVEGVHKKKDAAYVLHYSKHHDTLFAYTVLSMQNVSTDDIARWLDIQSAGDLAQFIVIPHVEFSGNTYRFTDSEDGETFLRLYITDIQKTRPTPALIVDTTNTQYGVHFDCLPDDLIFSDKLAKSAGIIAAGFTNMLGVFRQEMLSLLTPPSNSPREGNTANQK